MNIIESLELYTASQKILAYRFLAIGIVLALCFLIITLMNSLDGPLWSGLKVGSLVCAILIIAFSLVYINFSNKTHNDLLERHSADQGAMLVFEVERMEKIVREFPIYKVFFSAMVLIGLGLMVFASPYWQGVGFAIFAMHGTMIYFELHSKVAIDRHYELLSTL